MNVLKRIAEMSAQPCAERDIPLYAHGDGLLERTFGNG